MSFPTLPRQRLEAVPNCWPPWAAGTAHQREGQAQIIRLKDDNAKLRQRVTDREQEIADRSAFKTTALSRLAAQHQEITALRAALANRANVRTLPATLKSPDSKP